MFKYACTNSIWLIFLLRSNIKVFGGAISLKTGILLRIIFLDLAAASITGIPKPSSNEKTFFSKVKEKSKDNHLYYIQYCYARISSIFRNTNIKIDEKMATKDFNFEYAANEIQLIKKISEWPKCIEVSTFKLEPHRIPTYLYELSSEFHSYWNLGRDDKSKRFIDNGQITKDKLILLKSMALVIKSGLNILGVDSPEKM